MVKLRYPKASMHSRQEKNAAVAPPFDDQAATFDGRAGLPHQVSRAIARAVNGEAVGTPGPLLDLGAGTGDIGVHLVDGPRPYLGLDASLPMLTAFRRKLAAADRGNVPSTAPRASLLLAADADRTWPVKDASLAVVFSSRAIHLLRLSHLVKEVQRTGQRGTVVVLGRVQRRQDSLRQTLRRHMRQRLAALGVDGRSGGRARSHLVEALTDLGWRPTGRRRVASWRVEERPRDSLEAWRRRGGLAGRRVPNDLRRRLLDDLQAWALDRYGDLDAVHVGEESYDLESVQSTR